VRVGPKAAVDGSPLPFRSRLRRAGRFAAFCRQYVIVPKGKGALKRLRLRPWQTDLVASVLDPDPPPSLAGWMLPRGQGKSALVAALGLYDLMLGAEGASVVVVATDERQAGIVFGAAARMVKLHPELAARMQVYQDRLVVPARGARAHLRVPMGALTRQRPALGPPCLGRVALHRDPAELNRQVTRGATGSRLSAWTPKRAGPSRSYSTACGPPTPTFRRRPLTPQCWSRLGVQSAA
jgi:hypothetical protein